MTNTNTNTIVNTTNTSNQNVNIIQQGRVKIESAGGVYLLSTNDFSLKIPGSWYTTEVQDNRPVLFIASNENTDGVLSIKNRETSFVMNLSVNEDQRSLVEYLEDKPVDVGELISEKEMVIASYEGAVREIDATSIDSMEGSYSLEYFVKKNSKIIRVLFLALSKGGIDSNRSELEKVVESFE